MLEVVYNCANNKMSVETNQPQGVGYENPFFDGYMSSMETASALHYHNCSLAAEAIGIPTEVVLRVRAFNATTVDYVGSSLSELKRASLAEDFTAIARHLEDVPLDLYSEAQYAFRKIGSPRAIAAVAIMAKTEAGAELVAEPEALGELAYGMSFRADLFDYNVELAKDMGDLGVLQRMRRKDRLDTNVLFASIPSHLYGRHNTDTELERYTKHRSDLMALLRTPGLDRLIASKAGEVMTYPIVAAFLREPAYDMDIWREKVSDLAALAASDETLAQLEDVVDKAPGVLDRLAPDSSSKGRLDVAVCRDMIAKLAACEPHQSPPNFERVLPFVAWEQRLQAAALCASTDCLRYVKGGTISFAKWLVDPTDGTYAEKHAMISDPVFIKGFNDVFTYDWTNRLLGLNTSLEGKVAESLIDRTLPDVARDIKQHICDNRHSRRDDFGIELYTTFYKRYKLNVIDLLNTWDQTGSDWNDELRERRITTVRDHAQTMVDLEYRHPGICRKLQDEFFVRCFGRLTPDMWVEQYNRRDEQGIYALAVLSAYDHNRALHHFSKNDLQRLYSEKQFSRRPLRLYETHSAREVALVAAKVRRRYGEGQVGFGIMGAHAYTDNGDAMHVGLDASKPAIYDTDFAELQQNILVPKTTSGEGLATLMHPKGHLLVYVCKGASEEQSKQNLTNSMAIALGATAFGMKDIAHTRTLELRGLGVHSLGFVNKDDALVATGMYNGLSLREEAVRAGLSYRA